ncbi:NUDIX hydrolase [Streptomyces paromomycinus]|uniref:NUDIX hydrolase n=1 Tax=Streptomyces paromomycinus TaxID=92743 RepID=A0A401VX87_STREY|nr:NUDIX hydrolase [Streptomyces paromomycinus]
MSCLYDGGVLDTDQLAAARLQETELLSWSLLTWEEAEPRLSPSMALRVRAALDALARGCAPVEPEDGIAPATP